MGLVVTTNSQTKFTHCDNSDLRPIRMSHVLKNAVIEIPKPEYPKAAGAVNASGKVTVRVLIDLKGEVVKACALDGHPLLRKAAVDAAKAGIFKPNFGLTLPQEQYGRRYLEDEITFTFEGKVRTLTQEPKLIDKFDRLPCSDLRGRTDNFLAILAEENDSVGFVVVSDDVDFHKAVLRRSLFENHIVVRNFDPARIRYVRRAGLGEFGTEFWTVPSEMAAPFEHASEWNYKLPENAKPFIVYSGGFHESECVFPTGADILLNYLKANPGSHGNVVIRSNGRKRFAEIKASLESEIAETNPSTRTRIKYFYVPIKTNYYQNEFWILP